MQTSNSIRIRPVSGGVGAEIGDIDLSEPLTDSALRELRNALNAHGVIFFRDQRLTPEQHIALAERFGTIHQSQFMEHVPGYPPIAEVRKEPDQTRNVGGYWHTDQSFYRAPSAGSILLAREVPESGGDTLFASMIRVYATLSDSLKQTLRGLSAVHSNRELIATDNVQATIEKTRGQGRASQETVHPVVIRHPDSGLPALYVNPFYTVRFEGWTREESAGLLAYLYQQATRPENTHRFQWRPGSIAFWDNRATWHYAVNDYDGALRLMHRITLKGVPLAAI